MKNSKKLDRRYMARALKLASYGLYTTYPNPAVGCVFVRGGKIIGEGWHHHAGQPHAEIMALKSAGGDVRGATAYVTLEPCSHYGRTPPCALRLTREGISRCVVASGDPNPLVSGKGLAILKEAGIEVETGVLDAKAWFLNRAFMKAITSNLPFVTLKSGMSLDARTALPSGESEWITCEKSRCKVQDLRARSDAIVTGSGTVIADDPRLSVRWDELPEKARARLPREEVRQPLKVVLDSRARLDPGKYRIFKEGKVLWCTGSDFGSGNPESVELDSHVTQLRLPRDPKGHISLKALLQCLGAMQIRRLMVEAGSRLSGAFLGQGLCDELYVFAAPKILGADARPAFDTPAPEKLDQALGFALHSVKKCGGDVRLHYVRRELEDEYLRRLKEG